MTASAQDDCATGAAPLPWQDATGVVFAQPWHAQVFAMAVALNEAGLLGWEEWGRRFSAHRRVSAEQGRVNGVEDYYEDWLETLQEIVTDHALTSSEAIGRYTQAWAAATARTPHGKPIKLLDKDFALEPPKET